MLVDITEKALEPKKPVVTMPRRGFLPARAFSHEQCETLKTAEPWLRAVRQVRGERSKAGLGEEGQADAESWSKLGWLTCIRASACTILAALMDFSSSYFT